MRRLLNSLFITMPDAYLSLDGENVVVLQKQKVLTRYPLHNLESIITFGRAGASPALMGYCAKRNISLLFLTSSGKFLARVVGESRGNVVLRKKQYWLSEDERQSALLARNFILGKIYNHKWMIERMIRDHPMRIEISRFKSISQHLSEFMQAVRHCEDLSQLRGWEGQAARSYHQVFDSMILQQKEDFTFSGRSRRPPLDNVNALLSFAYTLLTHDMAAALESVGLDAYVGFLHRDRPGRASLALDMIEELRGVYADRFILSLINKKIVGVADFYQKENGAIFMTDEARKTFWHAWHKKKQEKVMHPFLKERISWGLIPYAQALLLARFLRHDLDEYPPFFWK